MPLVHRLIDDTVADLWVGLRQLAEERLLELQQGLTQLAGGERGLEPLDRRAILERARRGEVVILDVRPEEEFQASHLPFARSMPLAELRRRLKDLPRSKPVVAYCRGPFCLMAGEAVEPLRKKGFRAQRLEDGVAEWRSRGLPLATEGEPQ
jgi:rhodanese-related sulfurtransferase